MSIYYLWPSYFHSQQNISLKFIEIGWFEICAYTYKANTICKGDGSIF